MRCAVFYFYPMEYVIRNQKTDIRRQKTEDRKQETDIREQTPEDRKQEIEIRKQKTENRNQKSDIEAVGGHLLEGE